MQIFLFNKEGTLSELLDVNDAPGKKVGIELEMNNYTEVINKFLLSCNRIGFPTSVLIHHDRI